MKRFDIDEMTKLTAKDITKGNTFRCYLNEERTRDFFALAEQTDVQQTQLLTLICSAGIDAIKKSGVVGLPLPLRFKLIPPGKKDESN